MIFSECSSNQPFFHVGESQQIDRFWNLKVCEGLSNVSVQINGVGCSTCKVDFFGIDNRYQLNFVPCQRSVIGRVLFSFQLSLEGRGMEKYSVTQPHGAISDRKRTQKVAKINTFWKLVWWTFWALTFSGYVRHRSRFCLPSKSFPLLIISSEIKFKLLDTIGFAA